MSASRHDPLEPHALEFLRVTEAVLRAGDPVRILPRAGGDVFDLALAGKAGIIESIETDFEGRLHCAVVLDDDPGSDLGMARMPAHRFFFAPDELERLAQRAPRSVPAASGTLLIAGIGNIFLGDDAFGVAVVRRLFSRPLPENVTLVDYGIRGFDLACALVRGYDRTILVDACPRGEAPGTLYVMEPDLTALDAAADAAAVVDGHSMNPLNVLRLARTLGGPLNPVLLVGCEPESLGPEEGLIGLSKPVEAAVEQAVPLIESLIAEFLEQQTAVSDRTTS